MTREGGIRHQPVNGRGWTCRLLLHLAALLLWSPSLLNAASVSSPGTAQETVVAVFPEHFPPLYNVTANGLPTGFGIDLMEEVAGHAGLRITYLGVPDWSTAFAKLQNGEADLIPNLGVTEARRAFVDFTRPLERIPIRLFVRRGSDAPATLEGFRGTGKIIAVVRLNAALKLLQAKGDLQIRQYDYAAEALLDLFDGRVDAMAYPGPVLQALAARLGLAGRLQIIGDPLLVVERSIGVAKGRQALLSRLDAALAQTLASPAYQQIHARWYPPPPPFWTFQRVVYLVAGLLLLAAMSAVYVRFRVLRRVNEQLSQAKEFNDTILDAALEGIITLDVHGRLRSVNASVARIFSQPRTALLGAHISLLLPQGEADTLVKRLEALANAHGGGATDLGELSEYQALRRDGGLFPVRMGVVPVHSGRELLFVCTVEDLTRQREAERQARFYEDHDPLTGLLNQHGALLVLESLLSQAARYGRPLACVNIGVDRLSHVNDVHGRQVGDAVLTCVAERLRTSLWDSDVLAHAFPALLVRAGGDRFLAILPETDAAGAQLAAARVLHEVAQPPLEIDGIQLHVTGRAGIAVFPEHGASPQPLLSHAESALHLAKQQVTSAIRVFTQDDQAEERLVEQWVQRIRHGLQDERFELHFQPIQHIVSGGIHHFECLVRYRDDQGRLVLPGEFIPIAERFGLIAELDTRILELAITHLAGLEARGLDISLSVNISGAHIGENTLFLWLERLLEEHAVEASHIIIEITETAAMHNMLRARSFVESLRALGCRIALDDFGVGFSSFSHLRNLPVDIVKIDGSFVQHLVDNSEDQVLVKALTDIAHSLGKEVIAEFVCAPEILDMLRGYGVDYAQGFHIGRPLPLVQQLPA